MLRNVDKTVLFCRKETKVQDRTNKTKCWVFEKANKIDKFLASLIKREKSKLLVSKIQVIKQNIATVIVAI